MFRYLTAIALLASAAAPVTALAQATPATWRPATYDIPGERVFPEGIAIDRPAGTLFTGGFTDGAIYRGSISGSSLRILSPAGTDGRTSAIGMKVDRFGRLLVAGGGTGKLFVLSARTGATLQVLHSGAAGATFLNDVALARGAAYVTDSARPVILRAALGAAGAGVLEPWLDLTGTPFIYQDGVNANGIVVAPGSRVLLVIQSNTGKLFRIDVAQRQVSEVAVSGRSLLNGDGLVLAGRTLYVVRNADQEIVPVTLAGDLRSGVAGDPLRATGLLIPTSATLDRDRLLVVNSQLDKREGTPTLPFSITAVELPD